MAFIEEKFEIGSSDELKCWSPEFLLELGEKSGGIYWVIDRERDVFLRFVRSKMGLDGGLFAMNWGGEECLFVILFNDIKSEDNEDSYNVFWSIVYEIPSRLKPYTENIKEDFIEAMKVNKHKLYRNLPLNVNLMQYEPSPLSLWSW